jgi:carboxyl-terminal processing protease
MLDVLSLEDYAFKINDTMAAKAQRPAPPLQNQKVAVLTGPGTASSAEALAAMFQEREHTVLMGTTTAGMANATNGFVFNREDAYFLISVASLGNKNKEPLPE